MTATIAKALIEYGKEEVYKNPVEIARCRIATALVLHDAGTVDATELRDATELCVELYQTNLSETTTLGPEKFYSYLGLAEHYRGLVGTSSNASEEEKKANWRKVVDFADKALIERNEEKGALGSELRNERCIKAFLLKSEALTQLGLDTEAIEVCEQALGEDLEYTDDLLEFLKTIVNIHTKKGEWTKVIQAVQRQRPKIRSEWLWKRTDYWTDKKDSFRRAAVETRRVDFAIQVFEEAVEYWKARDTGHSVALQSELAVVYRRDARATKMAENQIDKLITGLVENRESLWLLEHVFPEMIDIHYENFTVTESKDVKRQIIGQVEKIIDRYENMQIIEPLTIGKALLVLAEMWSKFDGKLKAKQCAERAFTLCIADLEDTIGANDGAAFRLLAKVLMFANLEIDAKIALSLQFSYVNMNYDDSYGMRADVVITEPASKSIKGEPPVIEEQQSSTLQEQPGPAESETESQQVKETVNESGSPLVSIIPAKFDDKDNFASTQVVEITDVSTPADEIKTDNNASDALKKSVSDEKAMETLPSPAPSEDGNAGTVKVEPIQMDSAIATDLNGQDGVAVITTEEPEPPDTNVYQDIMDSEDMIRCWGPCMNPPIEVKSFGPMSEKMYCCLDCDNVQYCEPCYQTQIKFYDNYEEGFWYKSCWARHRFLSMPIDQWMGVRHGVIRIGKKEKLWKDWLLSVKSRWKRRMNEEEVSNNSSATLA